MLSFNNDYSEGAHERILDALTATNFEQTIGYGEDEYCKKAKETIREKISAPNSDIYFLSGGTQANMTIISHILKPYEAVIACSTGHISVHETGAIEATGHKVIEVDTPDFKLTAEKIEDQVIKHCDHHMVKPKMVYISNTTEYGTVYTLKDLKEIRTICDKYNLYLFLDGARLASALACEKSDIKLEDYAKYCDVFYIGGTKCGLLFGEAVVIVNDKIKKNFLFSVKQKGGLFAKGRLLGVQFLEMFKDNLYVELGKHSNEMAMRIKDAFLNKGFKLFSSSFTNQIFVLLDDDAIKKLEKKVIFSYDNKSIDGYKVARFVTSWATKESDVTEFIKIIEAL